MARELIAKTNNFTKKDEINCKNGFALQDFEGDSITLENVTKAAMMETTDSDTGELKEVSVLVTDDDQYMTSISSTIYDIMADLIDIIDEQGSASIRINKRKSKGAGRTFLTATIL